MLLAGAGIVLLVACGNVANLMLSEIVPRSRELALRAALGAGRWRLVRMLLTESVVVAAAGGVGGLGLASWCIDALVAAAPAGTPNIDVVRLDYRVFLFSLALALGTGFLFGVVPAWLAARTDVPAGLKEARPTQSRTGGRLQRVVCAAQVALAVTVLAVAALLVQSLIRLSSVDPGFSSHALLAFNVELPRSRYPAPPQRRAAYDELRTRILSVPGVRDVTETSSLPFRPSPFTSNPITVAGGPRSGSKVEAERRYVLPNLFDVLGIRLIAGEWLRQAPAGGDCQILVSQATVRTLWPDGGALGAQVRFWGETCTVEGVVTDTKERSLAADPLPTFYRIENGDSPGTALLAKSDVALESLLPAIRKAVALVDPEVAVLDPAPMDVVIARSLAAERYRTLPLALFALATLLLAAVGTYGVVSQMVARHRRAFGIRLALGARPAQVMSLVLRHTATITLAGLVAGVVAAFAATRLFRAFLYGVAATDVATYIVVVIALALLMFAAGWIPARRATRLDPAEVLRAE
jgi:predicted permease